jgi:L-xylulokinase
VTKKYLVGIDNGGTVAKAAVFTHDGRELAAASCKNEVFAPQPGWAEFDADHLWQATARAVRQAILRAGVRSQDVAAVACTGHGNGIYLVDKEGRTVRRAIFSSDSRARAYVKQWVSDGVDREVRSKTMQALWPGQPNALLAWLRDHEPNVLRNTRWVLMCKDFIRFRLTGEAYAEVTDASGTSLLDVQTGQYDSDILEAFGITEIREKLAPVRQSADVCGQVTPAAADETGLTPGTPVAGGLFDIDACALSSALTDESQLGMTLGTWGINQYVSRTPVTEGVFMTSRYCVPGHYLMLEGSATSASNLEWFLGNVFDAKVAPREGQSIYERVDQLVAESWSSESSLMYVPFLYGSNMSPDATAGLIGMRASDGVGHVLRAVYEGVLFAHMTHWNRLLDVRSKPERIRASGGASRSDVWMQMVADAFQVPVEVPEGSELGAKGAAICASLAAGFHPDYETACAEMVRFSRHFVPNPELAKLYQAKYTRYEKFLQAMEPTWRDLV